MKKGDECAIFDTIDNLCCFRKTQAWSIIIVYHFILATEIYVKCQNLRIRCLNGLWNFSIHSTN